MKVLRHLQAFCIAIIILRTGAGITLTAVTTLNETRINGLGVRVDFECGSIVTFVCEIKPYGNQAVWQVNSTTYAVCLFQSCSTNPPYPAYHNFSMSLTTETFNLTTDPITLASQRSIYSCNDGVTALSVDAIVKVYVKNETLEMDTSTANEITLTTGCVYPYGREDMTFQWFISKDPMLLEKSRFVRDEIQNITQFACAETSDCADAEATQFKSTVVFDLFDSGDDYHICAAVQHIDEPDRPRAVHCSVKTYKFRNYASDGPPKKLISRKEIILIIMCFAARLPYFQQFTFLIKKRRITFLFSLAGCFGPGVGLLILICMKDIIRFCRKEVKKMILFILSIIVFLIDYGIIILFAVDNVYEMTQLSVNIPVAVCYIFITWIISCIHFQSCQVSPRCKRCKKFSRGHQMQCDPTKCIKCFAFSDYLCKGCNMSYCKQCVKQDGCKMICGLCNKIQHEMKTYCLECKKFLCDSCCSTKHKCKGTLLKHPQHGAREGAFFCESTTHLSGYSADGYCLKCNCYACTDCLTSLHTFHHLLWIKDDSDPKKFGRFFHERDRICCLRAKSDETKSEGLGYCLSCEIYICLLCSSKHELDKHQLIMHNTKVRRNDSDSGIKYCAEHADKFAECYGYTEHAYLCADCFKHGYHPEGIRKYTPALPPKRMTPCVLHKFKNSDQQSCHTVAYCLLCKICLCRECYDLHGHFKEHYRKTHERNSYFCKHCKNTNDYFPVEFVNLDSFTLACAGCFEGKAKDVQTNSPKDDELVKALKSKFPKVERCQIHQCPFSDTERSVQSKVYCLFCKLFMCKECFRKHICLKSVWSEKDKLEQIKIHCSDFDEAATELRWKAIVYISLLGIFVDCFCKSNQEIADYEVLSFCG